MGNSIESIEGIERIHFPSLQVLWICTFKTNTALNKINKVGNLAKVNFPHLLELGIRKNILNVDGNGIKDRPKIVYLEAKSLTKLSLEKISNEKSLEFDNRWVMKLQNSDLKTLCMSKMIKG